MVQIEGAGVSNVNNIAEMFEGVDILVEHNTKWLDTKMLPAWTKKLDSESKLIVSVTIVNTLRLACLGLTQKARLHVQTGRSHRATSS